MVLNHSPGSTEGPVPGRLGKRVSPRPFVSSYFRGRHCLTLSAPCSPLFSHWDLETGTLPGCYIPYHLCDCACHTEVPGQRWGKERVAGERNGWQGLSRCKILFVRDTLGSRLLFCFSSSNRGTQKGALSICHSHGIGLRSRHICVFPALSFSIKFP